MPNSNFRSNSFLVVGSVLAGLAIALLATRLWPQLVRRSPPSGAAPGALVEPAPQAEPGAADVRLASARARTAAASATTADPLAQATDGSFSAAVKVSAPAVVSIYTRSVERVPALPLQQIFGRQTQPRYRRGLGSGVIVDAAGHIVTNDHVVARSVEIAVQLADGRAAVAQLVGSDPDTDLAVLKIDLPRLPVMQLGRSDRVAVGDVVLAIGNPFGLTQTVTHGIVSATGRADLGVATYEDFIQTDAAINEGNSGGALVNTRGELIGINTAVLGKNLGAEGIGVAIPVDLVRGVMSEIVQRGRVVRGWVGIAAEDVSTEVARANGLPRAGVVVSDTEPSSPAAQVGLEVGDIIETIDGEQVKSAQDARARIADRKPGSNMKLGGLRGNQRFSVLLVVREAPRARSQ